MTIRPAKAADTVAVIGLMEEAHRRSRYAQVGGVHRETAKAFLVRCVQLHGHLNAGGTLYLVAEKDGAVTGFFIALLARVYVVGTLLEAQDIFLYMNESADRRDFRRCIKAFDNWAQGNPRCIEATLSNSDFIPGAKEILERIYVRRGYEKTNNVFKRRFQPAEAVT